MCPATTTSGSSGACPTDATTTSSAGASPSAATPPPQREHAPVPLHHLLKGNMCPATTTSGSSGACPTDATTTSSAGACPSAATLPPQREHVPVPPPPPQAPHREHALPPPPRHHGPTYREIIDLLDTAHKTTSVDKTVTETLAELFISKYPHVQIHRPNHFLANCGEISVPTKPSSIGSAKLSGSPLVHYRSRSWIPKNRCQNRRQRRKHARCLT